MKRTILHLAIFAALLYAAVMMAYKTGRGDTWDARDAIHGAENRARAAEEALNSCILRP